MDKEQSPIINPNRGMMKVYAARDYIDDTYRKDNTVEVNVPEYKPTIPQDDNYTNVNLSSGYFVNKNYPATDGLLKSKHSISLPLLHGTHAPVRFNKGAEFLLIYPTGKIQDGFLLFIKDKPKDDEEGST